MTDRRTSTSRRQQIAPTPLAYRIPKAAEEMRISADALGRFVSTGQMQTKRIGKTVVILREVVDRACERLLKEYPYNFILAQLAENDEKASKEKRRIENKSRKAHTLGIVYLISDGEHTKIGFTTRSAASRLASLQTGHPKRLSVLATFPSITDVERKLHEKFAHLRMNGEWFRHEQELSLWASRGCPIISAERGNIGNIKINKITTEEVA